VFKTFIDGSWTRSSDGTTFELRTPIDGSVIARFQRCNGVQDLHRRQIGREGIGYSIEEIWD
jgi:acyl-CoA reductase-like NAD-dependent aldehyde dehydrogenase